MKKTKTLAAFLLSLALLTPLFACGKENLDTSSSDITSEEEISSDSGNSSNGDNSSSADNDTDDEETQAPSTPAPTPTPPVSTPTVPSTPTPETPTVSSKAQYIRCTGSNVNIRSGAGTSYSVLGSAEKGTNYTVLSQNGGWYKTYYKNQVAYVYASYASVFTIEKSTDEETEDVIEEGYKLLGVPYVYGAVRLHNGKGKLLAGFSAQKFDCSSLIQYIFYKGAGVNLDVTTRTQIKQGKYVAPKDLQRGDCIFFTNEERVNNTGIERVGHVALYLGDNYILHTASDYARIEQISTKRWSYYIEARRFL